jgi:hypothetical protein
MTATAQPLAPYADNTGMLLNTAISTTDDFFVFQDDNIIRSMEIDSSTFLPVSLDTEVVIPLAGTTVNSMAVDPVNRLLCLYGNNTVGTAHDYELVSYDTSGALTQLAAGPTGVADVDDDNNFMVTYSSTYDRWFSFFINSGGTDDLYYTYGTPAGASITWNTTPVMYKAGTGVLSASLLAQVGGDKVAVVYVDSTDGIGLIVGQQSTTTIAWGSAVIVDGAGNSPRITTDGTFVYVSYGTAIGIVIKKYSLSGTGLTLVATISDIADKYPNPSVLSCMGLVYTEEYDRLFTTFSESHNGGTAIDVYMLASIPTSLDSKIITPCSTKGAGLYPLSTVTTLSDGTGSIVLSAGRDGSATYLQPYIVTEAVPSVSDTVFTGVII